jgi:hypothetical protein
MSAVSPAPMRLVDHFQTGLDAPIRLAWELTHACMWRVCTVSRAPAGASRALSTEQCMAIVDELERMQVF